MLRDLGVEQVRVNLTWNTIAPSAPLDQAARRLQRHRPAAYSAGGGRRTTRSSGTPRPTDIGVDFTVNGPAPLWATGSGAPRGTTGYFRAEWQPSATEFGYFVKAVGTRYSGSYKPAGSATALPRVSFWSIWNEPNYGFDIAPQGTARNQSIPNSPHIYRNLVDAAWSSLQATGHTTRTDKILFGEVTPHGENAWGVFANMKPLIFLRSLYCVDSGYHELRGSAARAQGCPTTAAGSRSFRKQNPALFSASGFADHPYEEASAPNDADAPVREPVKLCAGGHSDPDFADLPEVPRLERTLDRLNGIYGSHTHFPVWSTEYGFRTEPPDPNLGVSQANQAVYMNWAEYLSYRQPRLHSYSQYQLIDQPPPASFDTGLVNPNGSHKPGFDAVSHAALPAARRRPARAASSRSGAACARRASPGWTPARPRASQIQFQTGSKRRMEDDRHGGDHQLAAATSTSIWRFPAAAR